MVLTPPPPTWMRLRSGPPSPLTPAMDKGNILTPRTAGLHSKIDQEKKNVEFLRKKNATYTAQ